MITPEQAQAAAKKAVQQYLNDCSMQSAEQVGDVLMMLVSTAAQIMAQAVGSEDAFQRLEAIAVLIQDKMPKEPAQMVPVQ